MLNAASPALSLKQRVIGAGAWNLIGYGLTQTVRFGSNLVLTRLLVPDMFALMSIATIAMVGLGMFSDVGLRPIIIQSKRGADRAFLNTAWVVLIIRGLLLWLVGLCISLLLIVATHMHVLPKDSVYADVRLPSVIAASSFSFLVLGFSSTKFAESYRHLALGRITLIEFTSQTAAVICMFIWVLFDRSVAVLVAGYICGAVVRVVLSHLWLPGIPNRLQWDASAFQEIFHFGKWIFASSLISFLSDNSDRLILGSVVDSSTLGVYVIAFTMISLVQTIFMRISSTVALPALSEVVRERPETLKTNYYRMHLIVAGFVYFCAGGFVLAGEPLVQLLYDPRYAQAGWMLQILAISLLAFPSQMAILSFVALGLPKLQSIVFVCRLVFICFAMPAGFYSFGLAGALWGLVLGQLVCIPLAIFYSNRLKIFDLKRELLPLPMIFIGAGAGKLFALLIENYHRF